MATSRWDPLQEVATLREQVDRLLNPVASRLKPGWTPPTDVYERGDVVYVELDLPGVQPEDVQIELQDRELTVRGERHLHETGDEAYERSERPSGSFERRVALPGGIAGDGAHAMFEDGVLEIRVHKAPASEPRRIDIQRGTLHSRTEGRDGPLNAVAIGSSFDDTELGIVDPDGTTEYDPSAHRSNGAAGRLTDGGGI